ncbi:MAG: hypothetical protein HFE76_16510 [Firmicutes bacterium]|nr:hypothetical protein [Bacillota bacterium]
MNLSQTPYDDVFRTLLNDCSRLILPMINEVFQEAYTGREEITFSQNEHFQNQQDGEEEKRITDSSFAVQGKTGTKKYHWECQSTPDSSMLIRFFEYDSQIALDEGNIRGYALHVTFPHSAVLFLRCGRQTPEAMSICIETPGGTLDYEIPVMKLQNYTLEELFEKDLLFLIPFYIFSHESRFAKYETDGEELEVLCREYAEIRRRLERLCREARIDEYTKCAILDMSNRVLEHIAEKYSHIKEGVKAVMGGRVLEYEAKTILNRGIARGVEQGKKELVDVMLKKGKSYEEISELTDIPIKQLKQASKVSEEESP